MKQSAGEALPRAAAAPFALGTPHTGACRGHHTQQAPSPAPSNMLALQPPLQVLCTPAATKTKHAANISVAQAAHHQLVHAPKGFYSCGAPKRKLTCRTTCSSIRHAHALQMG